MASPCQIVPFSVFMSVIALLSGTLLCDGSTMLSIDTDKMALLSFKSRLNLSSVSSLSSWNEHSSPCNWTGVSCSRYGSRRVVELHLSGFGLTGSIDPHVGNLSFLESLQLQNNKFTGPIPRQIGNLLRLRVVNMSSNNLEGGLPFNFSAMAALEILDLMSNEITGRLPEELGSLTNLQVLNLAHNQLFGTIPATFGNISSLVTLNLGTNRLSGSIPSQVGDLKNLKHVVLRINDLSGAVPPNVFNMSSLVTMALASNRLGGTFPNNIGESLPNLLVFHFCFNEFTGTIPRSFHNITKIQVIRFAHNFLHGTVPPGLENLRELSMYNIGSNRIVSVGENGLSFITSLTNSSHLNYLAIDDNQLEGLIPASIGNLSKDLSILNMGGNRMYGNIPTSIANLRGLSLLNLSDNSLSGEIPPQIGNLEKLQKLGLARNRFSGSIPSSLGDLRMLSEIDFSGNDLAGNIPTSFGNFTKVISLDLSNNKLNGSIPRETLNLPGLSMVLNLSNNLFSGSLPEEIGSLENVVTIDISNNHISGNIPPSISGCRSLEVLIMARNEFSGPIPGILKDLRGLRRLDISLNYLSGLIPKELQSITGLQYLNLSFNNLEGAVPRGGVFESNSRIYLEGNPKLCLYPSCPESGSKRAEVIKVIAFTAVFSTLALCFIIGMLIYFKTKKSKIASSSIELLKGEHEMVSYDELRLATKNFSEKNLIGKGSFGSVYMGSLKQGIPVAIKVLDINRTGSTRSFMAECEALRNARHRNLVKLITSCSSIDFSNMEFRALIFELLSNGSLDGWIHGRRSHESGIGLNILERMNIAIDVASAINYLHHDCELPIVHCDLKPSNILLDADMTAKVGDFGLARLLIESEMTQSLSSTHVLKGSIGYLPPEYGFGVKPTTAGDVYSFGVTLLELFTGKSPTDEYFTGEQNLVKWVESCFPADVMEVIDFKLSKLCMDLEYERHIISLDKQKDCLIKVIGVALLCTMNSPTNRIDMKDAVSKLKNAKGSLICSP
ncbi:putative receptor-like protein kinase At3g47110 [Momordica charantia]|uniref:non-specific serine/threonine protein kinase n=1 Tax=Momordica charantia TaxID=3673 RepID=A0A6J1BRT9_MOMCH|nr:putative receptor-like protein kinase At3g47110 [Momordica charantia]